MLGPLALLRLLVLCPPSCKCDSLFCEGHTSCCCCVWWLALCTGLQIFLQAPPDVVILEVGIGGRIDATNIIKRTTVTGGRGRSSLYQQQRCAVQVKHQLASGGHGLLGPALSHAVLWQVTAQRGSSLAVSNKKHPCRHQLAGWDICQGTPSVCDTAAACAAAVLCRHHQSGLRPYGAAG